MPQDFTFWLCMAFLVSEVVLSRVRRSKTMKQDAGSLRVLHWTIGICITAGVVVAVYGIGAYTLPEIIRISLCAGLLVTGAVIRWIAIVQLGKHFTVAVEIQDGHTLIQSGLYRYVRHPSYSGLVLEFIGLSFYFSNWITQLLILLPISIALYYRIRVEETVLIAGFGEQYEEYSRRTWRIIPKVW